MPIYSGIALVAAALWLCWRYIALREFVAKSKLWQALAFSPALLLAIPLGDGLLLIHYLHGFFGALSVSSLALMGASMAIGGKALPRRAPVYGAIVVAALLLYLSAEGWLRTDIYAWGYSGWLLPAIVSALLLTSVALGNYLAAYLLSANVLTYAIGLHPSSNIWDLLLDFPLALTLAVLLARQLIRNIAAKQY